MIYRKIRLYAPERAWLAYLGICLALLAAVLSVGGYYYLYGFLRSIIVDGNTERAVTLAIRIVILLAANTVCYFASVWTTHALAFRLETNLKKLGIRHLMGASFSFFDKHESGRVRKLLDDNTVLTHTSVAHLIPDLATAFFIPLLGAVLAFYLDWRLGVLFVTTLVVGMYIVNKMMGNKEFMAAYMKASEVMNAGAVEYVRGIQVMKIFRANVQSLKAFYHSVVTYSDQALAYSMSCRRWYTLFQVFFNAVFLVTIFLFYIHDADPLVALSKFMFYVLFNGILFIAFMKVMYFGMHTYQANASIENIEKLLEEMDERKLSHGTLEEMGDTTITFQDVSFGYGDQTIIDGLSFTLPGGKTYALVGASGSGKSTVAKLISGFYTVNGGEIAIGEHPITAYTEGALARNIANVFQDARLFKKTIYDNVLAGRPDATREEVMEALHQAQCDEILARLPEGENTLYGAKGVHLSGGEVQRIAVARAILKNARIVILDEASAAADPENEYELQRALANLMKGRTVIMIAHRLSSIKRVDEVLVMDQGAIVERGSHQALMAGPTRYRQLQEQFTQANDWTVMV